MSRLFGGEARSGKKHCSITIGSLIYELVEAGSLGGYTQYRLLRDAADIGGVDIPSHLDPRFEVSKGGALVIYGGVYLYVVHGAAVVCGEEGEEVSRVWLIGDEVIAGCETYFVTRRLYDLAEQRSYEHDEIIVSSRVIPGGLIVFADFQNRAGALNIETPAVVPVPDGVQMAFLA